MKTKRLMVIAATVALLFLCTAARSDEGASEPTRKQSRVDVDVFHGNQPSVDLFGTFANRDRFGRDLDRGGGGAGLNYFFNRYMGIGADTYLEEWRWPYRVDGSAILRLPLQAKGIGFAPYAIGGGGREFKYAPQYTWHAGGGLEFKFCPTMGIFADIRRVFPDKTEDYTLIRGGIRLGF